MRAKADQPMLAASAARESCMRMKRLVFAGLVGLPLALVASPVVPLRNTGLASVSEVGVYSGQGCAFVGARLYCWGKNLRGELGVGAPGVSSLAEWVRRPDSPTGDFQAPSSLAVSDRTCTSDAAGVWCWGQNDFGQLGTGDRVARVVPTRVPGLPAGILEVAQGPGHTCARAATGVWCWGANLAGETGQAPGPAVYDPQLGITQPPPQLNALQVPALGATEALALGIRMSCALAAGEVRCWGDNAEGQLGSGDTVSRSTPRRVDLPPGIRAISAGQAHVCALAANGEVWCWGRNSSGQAGAPLDVPVQSQPLRVAGLPGPASAILAEVSQSCARLGAERWCWGSGDVYPASPTPSVPARPEGAPPDWLGGCFQAAGELRCPGEMWRHPYQSVDARPLPPFSEDVAELALGSGFGCARLVDGVVWCWGANDRGQLGQGHLDTVEAPVRVPLPAAGALTAGRAHACAVTGDGLWCWGANWNGQLGDGGTQDRPSPVRARFPATLAAAGDGHSCAWSAASGLRCWGRNESGQVNGLPGAGLPDGAAPLGAARVLELAVGWRHSCATVALAGDARETRCWGRLPLTEEEATGAPIDTSPRVFPAGNTVVGDAYPRLRSSAFTTCIGDRCSGLGNVPPDRGVLRAQQPLQLEAGTTGFSLGGTLACIQGAGTNLRCSALTNTVCAFDVLAGLSTRPGWPFSCLPQEAALTPAERGWLGVIGLPARPGMLTAGDHYACGVIGRQVWCWGRGRPYAPPLASWAHAPVYRAGALEPAPVVDVARDPARACPAYVVSSVSLLDPLSAGSAGAWGQELLLADGRRQLNGGLNFGGFGSAAGVGVPGYAAFSIQNPSGGGQRVTLDLAGDGGEFVLTVESTLPPATARREVLRETLVLGSATQRRTLMLANGFHIVVLQPTAGSRLFLAAIGTTQPDGSPAAFDAGAVVGGWLQAEQTGFAGLCTDDARAVRVRTEARSSRGADGAGDLRLRLTEGQSGELLFDSGGR